MKVEQLLIDKLLNDIYNEQMISKVYSKWKYRNEENKRFSTYLKYNKFNCAAIYGLGRIGRDLYYELVKDGVEISFLADRFSNEMFDGREVLGICDVWPYTDVVIVTQITDIDGVYRDIKGKNDGATISFIKYIF